MEIDITEIDITESDITLILIFESENDKKTVITESAITVPGN